MTGALMAVVILVGIATSALAQTVVTSDVMANTTWGGAANPSPIILDGAIHVKSGAILTILPGTVVRGQPRQASQGPGTLIVTRTGRINAVGTVSQPIVMTTAATDNNNDGIPDSVGGFKSRWDPGDLFFDDSPSTAPVAPLGKDGNANVLLWGGVVVLGNAPTNLAGSWGNYGEGYVEGLMTSPLDPEGFFGGVEAHDDSGTLRYLSIRHAGNELDAHWELAGLSLAGVGDGTEVDNVEVYASFADGIRVLGGTVHLRHVLVSLPGGTAVDVDHGYSGIMQFILAVMPFFNEQDGGAFGGQSGHNVATLEGEDFRPTTSLSFNDNVNVRANYLGTTVDGTPWPFSNVAIYNLTALGSTPDAPLAFPPVSPAPANRGLYFTNGFAGSVFNSIIVNTGTQKAMQLDTSVFPCAPPLPAGSCGPGVPGFQAADNATAGLVNLVCSTLDDGAALTAEATIAANGDSLNLKLGGTSFGANVVNSASFNGLVEEDQTFPLTGNAAGKIDSSLKPSPIDPRPATGFVGTGGCVPAKGPGLAAITYRGAFSAAAGTLWTTDWTALNVGGVLAD